ncbi:MAG: alpha/beta hydrolase [Deltaproteobacteria bacterium]|nr:alpha/beta hydrolase [Deltaproteobacteria bacterium]
MQLGSYTLAYSRSATEIGETCLLLLHGLQSRKEVFADLRAHLDQVLPLPHLAVDFLGFGESDKPEDFTYALNAQLDVLSMLLRRLGIRRVHVIGHSRGGMTGTLLLDSAPEMVGSLISLEGNLCYEDCGESKKVAALDFHTFRSQYYPELKAKLANSNEPSAHFRLESLDLIPDYAFYRTSCTTVSIAHSGSLLESYRRSHRPKLMICGMNSPFRSRIQGEQMSLVEIPNAGHFMLADNPEAVKDAVSSFLCRHV